MARGLRRVAAEPPLTDFTASTLEAMWDLRSALLDASSSDDGRDHDLADVLAALKRLRHFPLMTRFQLEGWARPIASGGPDDFDAFSSRIQVIAFLVSDDEVCRLLALTREVLKVEATRSGAALVDAADDLRLLCTFLVVLSGRVSEPAAVGGHGRLGR